VERAELGDYDYNNPNDVNNYCGGAEGGERGWK